MYLVGKFPLSAGGTLSATRASSRASSRSGCTSGTLEDEPRRDMRRAATPASRAGAARAAAILLISRHLGGAHPPKCAAKGETDNVCAMGLICTSCGGQGLPECLHASHLTLSMFKNCFRTLPTLRSYLSQKKNLFRILFTGLLETR